MTGNLRCRTVALKYRDACMCLHEHLFVSRSLLGKEARREGDSIRL